jgi:hypothetical protein
MRYILKDGCLGYPSSINLSAALLILSANINFHSQVMATKFKTYLKFYYFNF